jgi:CBS domain-containing protein
MGMSMNARDVMVTELITVEEDTPIHEAARLLEEHDISSVPVVGKHGMIIGMVSEGDLIYRLVRPHIPPHIEILGAVIYLENPFQLKKEMEKLKSFTAGEIMTKEVHYVSPDTDVSDIAALMIEEDVDAVAVVENNKLVGLVTRHDLLSALSRGNGDMTKLKKPELTKEQKIALQVSIEEEEGGKALTGKVPYREPEEDEKPTKPETELEKIVRTSKVEEEGIGEEDTSGSD